MKVIIWQFLFVSLLFMLPTLSVQGQAVEWQEEEGINSMLERHIFLNKQKQYVQGWRVQILVTTDRLEMQRALRTFEATYPELPINWVHEKPWYKLRTGAFIEKYQAIQLQHRLKEAYPGAYPTKDLNMHPKELVD